MAIVERELGLLTLGFERGLDDHLASCGDCRRRTEKEGALVGELMALRELQTPAVEVRENVMRQVRSLPAIEPGWVPQGQLAWASAAAVATAIGLVAWIWPRAAWLREAAGGAADGTRALLSAAYSMLVALKTLLVLPWRVLSAVLETMSPLFDGVSRLEPYAVTAISLGLVSMAFTIAWVVGHDLRRPLPIAWRKEE
jgi:hypothetical protein